jgi:nucleotide-binding universal stress UspA family protein
MAIRDILFHLDTSEAAQSLTDFAVSLADVTGAHLTAGGVVIEYPPPAADMGGSPRVGISTALSCMQNFPTATARPWNRPMDAW